MELDTSQANQGAGPQDSQQKPSPVDGSANQNSQVDDKGKEGEFDISKLDPRAQKLIHDLRKENGDHRIKNRALAEGQEKLKKAMVEAGIIEDDEGDPQEKLQAVGAQLQGATVKGGILEAGIEYGVGKEGLKYFEFLVADRLQTLGDDEELTQEDLAELAKEARGRQNPVTSTTSVPGNKSPNPQASGEVTLDQFVQMSITDKSLLYTKNPDLYNRLFSEAKAKKLLFK